MDLLEGTSSSCHLPPACLGQLGVVDALTVPFWTDLCSKSTCFLSKDTGRRSCSVAATNAFPSTLPGCSPFTSHRAVRAPAILQTLITSSARGGGEKLLFSGEYSGFWFLGLPGSCCPSEQLRPPKKSERFWNTGLLVLRVAQMQSTEARSCLLLSFHPSSLFPDL